MTQNLRDYGYGTSPDPTGPPEVIKNIINTACPNCKCSTLYLIQVPVEAPAMLKIGKDQKAYTIYTGCPACPWASPAVITAR